MHAIHNNNIDPADQEIQIDITRHMITQHMSPEAHSGHYTVQTDVWSLGCILYQMVFGKTPFADLAVFAKMKCIT